MARRKIIMEKCRQCGKKKKSIFLFCDQCMGFGTEKEVKKFEKELMARRRRLKF